MAVPAVQAARSRPFAVWTMAFRPFFLAASVWSAVALTGWIAMLLTGLRLPSRFDPLTWHIHEMLFGFVMAAIAGFMLTAIPNWTGRVPISGRPLAALATLWLAGRLPCLFSALIPFSSYRKELPSPVLSNPAVRKFFFSMIVAQGAALFCDLGWLFGHLV